MEQKLDPRGCISNKLTWCWFEVRSGAWTKGSGELKLNSGLERKGLPELRLPDPLLREIYANTPRGKVLWTQRKGSLLDANSGTQVSWPQNLTTARKEAKTLRILNRRVCLSMPSSSWYRDQHLSTHPSKAADSHPVRSWGSCPHHLQEPLPATKPIYVILQTSKLAASL